MCPRCRGGHRCTRPTLAVPRRTMIRTVPRAAHDRRAPDGRRETGVAHAMGEPLSEPLTSIRSRAGGTRALGALIFGQRLGREVLFFQGPLQGDLRSPDP